MKITPIIRERCQANLFLPGLDQKKIIKLSFGANVDAKLQNGLYDLLEKMNIDLSSDFFAYERLGININKNAGDEFALTLSDGREFTVDDIEPEISLAWAVYALATGQNWLDGAAKGQIRVYCISLEQQTLARSLLDEIDRHFTGRCAPAVEMDLARELESAIDSAASVFSASAPRVSLMPVGTAAFEDTVGRGFGLLSGSISYASLLRQLGIGANLQEEAEAFCRYISGKSAYKERVNSIVSSVMDIFAYQPMSGAEEVMVSVCTSLKDGYEDMASSALNELRSSLEISCRPKKLNAAQYTKLLRTLDEPFAKLSDCLLHGILLSDILEAWKTKHTRLSENATRTMQNWRSELNRFCLLRNRVSASQRIKWTDPDSLDTAALRPDLFAVGTDNSSMLMDIVQNVHIPVGFNPRWLCGDSVFPDLQNIAYGKARCVNGLNGRLLVAFLVKVTESR